MMYRDETILKIKPLLEGYLTQGGYVLVDLRFFKSQGREIKLEIFADRQEGGITLDECTQLNRAIGDLLDQSSLIAGSYTLDVSSPGLDRPLATVADFHRARGRDIRVFLKEAIEGKIEYRGAIEQVDEDKIGINVGNRTLEIPLENINKAKQVIL